MTDERWSTEVWVFLLCVVGGCVAGIGAVLYLWALFAATSREPFTVTFVIWAIAAAAVVGVIIGIAVGVVVSVAGYVSQRLRGSRTPGIIAGVLGSCVSLAWVFSGLPELILYVAVVAVLASVVLSLAARERERRNPASKEPRVLSKDDVDSSEAP